MDEPWLDYPDMVDNISAALDAAEARGRKAGLEEAANMTECMAVRNCAVIADSIRGMKDKSPLGSNVEPKESGKCPIHNTVLVRADGEVPWCWPCAQPEGPDDSESEFIELKGESATKHREAIATFFEKSPESDCPSCGMRFGFGHANGCRLFRQQPTPAVTNNKDQVPNPAPGSAIPPKFDVLAASVVVEMDAAYERFYGDVVTLPNGDKVYHPFKELEYDEFRKNLIAKAMRNLVEGT